VSALSVVGLRKSYGGTPVLQGIDLHVGEGELVAVLGESGCGKTTLLRLVAGFDTPDDGTIAFGSQQVYSAGRSVPPQRRRVGYVPQEGALFPHLDVTANIAFGLGRQQRREPARVAELLTLVGLDPAHAHRLPHQLSGGQQQRVALARALAPQPSLVLLDEPFSSLDAGLRAETRTAVAQALRTAGATALLVTHDQAEALSVADRVAVVRAGRITQLDTPTGLYDAPADSATASFVGDAVLLAAQAHHDTASSALGPVLLRSPAEGPVLLLLRPEQISITDSPHPAGTLARVNRVDYYGHDATVALTVLPDGPAVLARTTARSLPEHGATVGLTVTGTAQHFPTPDTPA
jgi:iron(III) transport system ATP-binding protein